MTQRLSVTQALLIGSGGFAGSLSRYLVDSALPGTLVGTFVVNVAGSFALGLLLFGDRFHGPVPHQLRAVVAAGFLSSFTTFSAFVLDILAQDPLTAAVYVIASYVVGIGAVVLARTLIGPGGSWS